MWRSPPRNSWSSSKTKSRSVCTISVTAFFISCIFFTNLYLMSSFFTSEHERFMFDSLHMYGFHTYKNMSIFFFGIIDFGVDSAIHYF